MTKVSKYRQVFRARVRRSRRSSSFNARTLRVGGAAQPVANRRRGGPQQKERRSNFEACTMKRENDDGNRCGDGGAHRHLRREAPESLPSDQSRRSRCRRRCRLPLEQAASGDRQPNQCQPDRVHGLPRMKDEERETQARLRESCDPVVTKRAKEHAQRLSIARAGQELREQREDLRCEDEQHRPSPDRRIAGEKGPARDQQPQQRRRDQASAQVVENLPAGDERQSIALQAVPGRDEREQPEQNLPVTSDPAVLTFGMGKHARG